MQHRLGTKDSRMMSNLPAIEYPNYNLGALELGNSNAHTKLSS